ncbi:MAG: FdtA/QdtA family cupin domain-containing protein [Gammaproteobacteria bacterium]
MHNISDLQLIYFPLFYTKESSLIVYEGGKKVPFDIYRVFTVKSIEKCIRGFHAHKECTQLVTVLSGECKVVCDDGTTKKEIILNKTSEALLIPPTIWAEQEYQPNTILMVLTDKYYDENDYVRDYNEFLTFRNNL